MNSELKLRIKKSSLFVASLALSAVVAANVGVEQVDAAAEDLVINEWITKDPNDGEDWVEIYNPGTEVVDISGWILTDEKALAENEHYLAPEGTVIEPGSYKVLYSKSDFEFGLGKGETLTLTDASGATIDTATWDVKEHYTAYTKDNNGLVVNLTSATPGSMNSAAIAPEEPEPEAPVASELTIAINEVESSAPNDGEDWIELYNYGNEAVDISGFHVTDSDGLSRVDSGEAYTAPENTILQPGAFLYIENGIDFDFGIGDGDTITIYDTNDAIVDTYVLPAEHAEGTLGRNPDGTGDFVDAPGTPNASNIAEGDIVINEVSQDPIDGVGFEYVEIYNNGSETVDISGWYVLDDKGQERIDEGATIPLAQGTELAPGEFFTFANPEHFTFGLGKEDIVTIYDATGTKVTSFNWSSHVNGGAYGRQVDGQGTLVPLANPTPNTANNPQTYSEAAEIEEAFPTAEPVADLVINEVDSNPSDWVEFKNTTDSTLDISGYEFRDDSDDHRWRFAEGTELEAGELIVVIAGETQGQYNDDVNDTFVDGSFNFGIGGADTIRLYNPEGKLIDSFTWGPDHAAYNGDNALATWARTPDGTGKFYLSQPTQGAENVRHKPTVSINEIESSDPNDGADWTEIYNYGDYPIDISGWVLSDDGGVVKRLADGEAIPLAEGTILQPGEYFVFEGGTGFGFGLGNGDTIILYDETGAVVDEHKYDAHAEGTLSRLPNGTGEFVDTHSSTKGGRNVNGSPVVVNEVESSANNDGADWIEFYNPTSDVLDISGLVIKDSNDDNEYVIPEGTTIEANGYLVITEDDFGFGLGDGDSVRVFDGEELIQDISWDSHADVTYGLRPDNSNEYGVTSEATPGARNKFADIPELIEWPGSNDIAIVDETPTFLGDSSGLDFAGDTLYAIDNGTGIFWKVEQAEDGSWEVVDERRIRFQHDAGNAEAAGPDSEGITVDGDGLVYVASERDNSSKDVNYNVILQVNSNKEGYDLVADKEWDVTDVLPQVSANMGIEAIEWVANSEVEGKLFDQNTGAAYDAANYPNAVANGVFFVALESNGHVYALVLNEDETATIIADIDPKIGGAMGLDYDVANDTLWVLSDNGYNGVLAQIVFNGSDQPQITHVERSTGLTNDNHEGFAIAPADYVVNGGRPVFFFTDGLDSGSLKVTTLPSVIEEVPTEDPYQDLLDRLEALENRVDALEGENQALRDEINALRSDLDTTTAQIAELEARIVELEEAVEENEISDNQEETNPTETNNNTNSETTEDSTETENLPETGTAVGGIFAAVATMISGFGLLGASKKRK